MTMQVLPSTLRFLGEKATAVRDGDGVVYDIAGVSPAAVTRLSELLELPEPEVFALAGGGVRTYYRQRGERGAAITGAPGDALLRMARVVERTIAVLGDIARARGWLREPSAFLDARAPLALLGSDAGTQLVERELTRIQWGDY
jgi:putative toxin-antitoxin system antitoxin component (TIGR02293 family)